MLRRRCTTVIDMVADFTGFGTGALEFLDQLGRADKPWFDANRPTYLAEVVEPTKAFVVELGARLRSDISPYLVAEPKVNGSIAPINTDLRFSPDGHPYKDHVLLRFWQGVPKKTAPTLFVRLSARHVGFAAGAALADLEKWRRAVDDDETGPRLAAAIDSLRDGRDLHVAGEDYKRVPKPYAQNHPRADLLRHKMLQVRWTEPLPPSVCDNAFVDFCAGRLAGCASIHNWLVDNA